MFVFEMYKMLKRESVTDLSTYSTLLLFSFRLFNPSLSLLPHYSVPSTLVTESPDSALPRSCLWINQY